MRGNTPGWDHLGSPVPKSQVLENFHFQTLPLTPLTLLTRAVETPDFLNWSVFLFLGTLLKAIAPSPHTAPSNKRTSHHTGEATRGSHHVEWLGRPRRPVRQIQVRQAPGQVRRQERRRHLRALQGAARHRAAPHEDDRGAHAHERGGNLPRADASCRYPHRHAVRCVLDAPSPNLETRSSLSRSKDGTPNNIPEIQQPWSATSVSYDTISTFRAISERKALRHYLRRARGLRYVRRHRHRPLQARCPG